MQQARTNNIQSGTNCIEDRTFRGAQRGERNQLPGADVFFSVLRDVLALATTGKPTHGSLVETVVSDIKSRRPEDTSGHRDYYVHDDDSHGGRFEGCGFAAKVQAILTDLSENIDDIIGGLPKLDQTQQVRARELGAAAGELAPYGTYLRTTGGKLVQAAAEAGAHVTTHLGEHTRIGGLIIDRNASTTYDSVKANAADNDLTPGFNVDSNHAHNRAATFGLDGADAALFAELTSLATVRVLSDGRITQGEYV